MKIGLLYGTETGNSEMLCDDLKDALEDAHSCEIENLADVSPSDLDAETFYIIVTSTYGNGDLPSQAVAFEEALKADKPDLSGIRFAIFGLGDQVFHETFAHGSQKLMEMMIAAGATQVGERAIHAASALEMPEDVALPWLEGIMELATAEAA